MTDEEQNRRYWQGLREGDKESFFSLYNNTYFHLVRWGLKITANDEMVKDCVTQLFFQLWDKRHKLNPCCFSLTSIVPMVFKSYVNCPYHKITFRFMRIIVIS